MIKPPPLIFDIQRYAVNNGPGIRTTVFVKGCSLSCIWCHNPESISQAQEFLFHDGRCTQCRSCITACPAKACTFAVKGFRVDTSVCAFCGQCTNACPSEAIEIVGKEYTLQELMHEIAKDQMFFEISGGGVTFSGGEAMMHIDFLEQALRRCKQSGFHTVVDTCGYVSFNSFMRIIPYTDLFLYDLKCMDTEKHQAFTGRNNHLVLENLKQLSVMNIPVNLRLPLIEPLNTSNEDILAITDFIRGMNNITHVSLLPYHQPDYKYWKMGTKVYSEIEMQAPSIEKMEDIRHWFEQQGYKTETGY